MSPDLIGWASSVVLLLTIFRQVRKQWESGSSEGLSHWLFIGQGAASCGFVVYSWMLENWVFVVTNVLLLLSALAGQGIYLRNRRRKASATLRA